MDTVEIEKRKKAIAEHPLTATFGLRPDWARPEAFEGVKQSADAAANRLHEVYATGKKVVEILADRDLTSEAKRRRVAEVTADATGKIRAHFEQRSSELRSALARAESELSTVPTGDPSKSAVDEIARQFRIRMYYDDLKAMDVGERFAMLRKAARDGDPLPFQAAELSYTPLIPQREHFQLLLDELNEKVRPDAIERAQAIRNLLDAETQLGVRVQIAAEAIIRKAEHSGQVIEMKPPASAPVPASGEVA